MNLGQMIEACQFKAGYADSQYRNRWVTFINEAVNEFARRQPWPGLEDRLNVQTPTSTRYLILPPHVDTVISVLNVTDNVPVERGDDFEYFDPAIWAQGTVGRPFKYAHAGDVAATADPSGHIWLQSTHASDLGTIFVTGLVTNSGASGALESTYRELSLNATGTSPVTLSSLFTKIVSISKATDTNGDFYFYDAGNSNRHISFLPKTDTEARFRRLALLFKSDAIRTLEIRFRHRIPPLRQDAQSPHPSVKADFVVQHALSLHLQEQEQFQRQQVAEAKALKILNDESNKDNNFNAPFNQMLPNILGPCDASEDYFRVGW